jgi:hypothetical protein
MNNQCIKSLDTAISIIEEMKEMLTDGDHDAPIAFLEAYEDLFQHLNRAQLSALRPLLEAQCYGEVMKISITD